MNDLLYFHSPEYKRDRLINHHSARQYDLKKLDLLKEIHDKTKCTIVMSSSWRSFYFRKDWNSRMGDGCMRLKKDLKKRKITIRYKTGNEYDERLYAIYTGCKWVKGEDGKYHTEWVEPEDRVYPEVKEFYERGLQIKIFLDKWEKKYGKCNFAILDDDASDLRCFNMDGYERYAKTLWGWQDSSRDDLGLTRKHVEKCISILNDPNFPDFNSFWKNYQKQCFQTK